MAKVLVVNPRNPSKLVSILKAKPLVLYGMGGAGIRIAQWCDENKVDYVFADKDADKKQGILDKTVVIPEALKKDYPNAHIVITSIIYYDEIVEKLLSLGIDKKCILSYKMFIPGAATWKDLENTTVWGEHIGRVKAIAQWIPGDAASVADYGEGKLSLKKFLAPNIQYYPIDYIRRSQKTIICDFNNGDFPKIKADVSVCTATLVFITAADSLLKHLCQNSSNTVILSYVTLDVFPNIDGRRASGYVNDFTQDDIIDFFLTYGFILKEKQPDPANKIDTLFLFSKS